MDETLTLGSFLESWELFREPALAGGIAGAMLGFLGVYIVLRKMVFLSAALSQCAGLGITVAFFLQQLVPGMAVMVSPLVGSLAFTFAGAVGMTSDAQARSGQRDSLLGLIYLLGASGTLALSTRITRDLHDIDSLLFGSSVAVLTDDFQQLLGLGIVVTVIHLWLRRGFVLASFDAEGARVRGIPVRVLNLVLMLTLALAVSSATRVLGALPAFGFSVLPAIAAVQVAGNVSRALLLAAGLGGLSGLGGYVLAYLYALPVGAAQTLLAGSWVALAYVLRLVLRRWGQNRPAAS